ncbi:MAG: glycosyltransferase family 39 protein [Synechococcales bacterium]|nr:glycosyltransferase family 39 protein [Synechococcales bacterium]
MVVLLLMGLYFRVAHLDRPVYWVDEVATSIRVAGYTRPAIAQQLATGEPIAVAELQQFQQLGGDRPWADTWNALTQSPEHAPLYFLMVRAWAERFGSSMVAIRSLSVVLGVVAIPCFIWASKALLLPSVVGQLGAGLLAISPFFVAYSQEARPYSLWTVALLLLMGLLGRSLHNNTPRSWLGYILALVLSLYTSLLTGFVVLGQALAVLSLDFPRFTCRTRNYLLATGLGLGAFIPWGWIIFNHWQTLQDNTVWMREAIAPWATAAVWFYSLAVLWFDVPLSVDLSLETLVKALVALGVVALIGYAAFTFYRETPPVVGRSVILGAIAPPLVLLLIDGLRSGQAAATPRYLIPTLLGALVSVAYLLGDRLHRFPRNPYWRTITAALLSLGLLSCTIGLTHTSDYQKARNRANPAIAALINQSPNPVLLAEANLTMDVLSLSHSLDVSTIIRILPSSQYLIEHPLCREAWVLNPSSALQESLGGSDRLHLIYRPDLLTSEDVHLSLWRLLPDTQTCKYVAINKSQWGVPAAGGRTPP